MTRGWQCGVNGIGIGAPLACQWAVNGMALGWDGIGWDGMGWDGMG